MIIFFISEATLSAAAILFGLAVLAAAGFITSYMSAIFIGFFIIYCIIEVIVAAVVLMELSDQGADFKIALFAVILFTAVNLLLTANSWFNVPTSIGQDNIISMLANIFLLVLSVMLYGVGLMFCNTAWLIVYYLEKKIGAIISVILAGIAYWGMIELMTAIVF